MEEIISLITSEIIRRRRSSGSIKDEYKKADQIKQEAALTEKNTTIVAALTRIRSELEELL